MGKVLNIKVKESGSKEGYSYKNEINLQDPTLLSLILSDLEAMFDAPVRKACLIFLEKKTRAFPFSP